jgi:predicted nucleic acid-binding protein
MKRAATLDASFWINAQRVGLVPPVQTRYTLHYAPEVAAELSQALPSGRAFWQLARSGQLTEMRVAADAIPDLGPGEGAAINLARAHPDWVLLVDDPRPYQEAVRQGLRVLCSPVLVAAFYREGVLDARDAMLALARLAALQTVSRHLLAAAVAHLGRSRGAGKGE